MFELRKSFHFEASHQLVHHDGKCANLHGHSYVLTVELRSAHLIADGCKRNMVTDFSDISGTVKKVLKSHLDHHHLNDTLETDSPTSEYIAHWVYHTLKPHLSKLTAVEIRETATSSCTYRPLIQQQHQQIHHHEQGQDILSSSSPLSPYPANASATTTRVYSNGNGSIHGNGHGLANGNGNGNLNGHANGHSCSSKHANTNTNTNGNGSDANCAKNNSTIQTTRAATAEEATMPNASTMGR